MDLGGFLAVYLKWNCVARWCNSSGQH